MLQRCRVKGTLIHGLWECKMVQLRRETVWQFLTKLYNPAISLLNIYPKEQKTYICMWMLTAALFIIAKTCKQSRCPSVGEWINELWSIQTNVVLFSTEKKWTIKPWNDPEWPKCILLSERHQSEKASGYMIPSVWHSGKGWIVTRSVVAQGWGIQMSMWNTGDF